MHRANVLCGHLGASMTPSLEAVPTAAMVIERRESLSLTTIP